MRLLLPLLLAACLPACVTPVSMPQAPAVSTPAAQRCVDDCRTDYAQCEQPCGMGAASSRTPACQTECFETLDACYNRCSEL